VKKYLVLPAGGAALVMGLALLSGPRQGNPGGDSITTTYAQQSDPTDAYAGPSQISFNAYPDARQITEVYINGVQNGWHVEDWLRSWDGGGRRVRLHQFAQSNDTAFLSFWLDDVSESTINPGVFIFRVRYIDGSDNDQTNALTSGGNNTVVSPQ